MTDPVAHRRLICIRPSGESLELTLLVGKPYSDSQAYRCPVSVEPLYGPLRDLEGVDSWQALQLAMDLVERLLKSEVEAGSRLYWSKTTGDGIDSKYDFKP
jgi:hypothetical protein